jgi:hypothetical protein
MGKEKIVSLKPLKFPLQEEEIFSSGNFTF